MTLFAQDEHAELAAPRLRLAADLISCPSPAAAPGFRLRSPAWRGPQVTKADFQLFFVSGTQDRVPGQGPDATVSAAVVTRAWLRPRTAAMSETAKTTDSTAP
ncbi:hypothetical protein [Streptomyces sp. NPDC056921]|uniref:hypothetical protein n=1 Tax=Streptomyces sp. NPDC056921 TaxID=3345966 RepID=UPI003631CD57